MKKLINDVDTVVADETAAEAQKQTAKGGAK